MLSRPGSTPSGPLTHSRARSQAHSRVRSRGFTLIELLIVVGIISILSAVAYPAYKRHVLRTHRVTAAACLQELAMQMERRYSAGMSYIPSGTQPALPAAACTNAAADRYTFEHGSWKIPSATPGAAVISVQGPTDSEYLLQAVPKELDTECGTLGLSHQGLRSSSGTADVKSCWQ